MKPTMRWSGNMIVYHYMKMHEPKPKDFKEARRHMEMGIAKVKRLLEDDEDEPQFTSEEHILLYTAIYNICTQKPENDHSQHLYFKYRQTIEEYMTEVVVPSFEDKHGEFLLRELTKRWDNHKIMVRWMVRFFVYLDMHFIPTRKLPTLHQVGVSCFRDLAYQEVKGTARDVVISLIEREREGEQIDRTLLKNVLAIFVEVGAVGNKGCYENDFEAEMVDDTGRYYSRKAKNWIAEDSCPVYMLKVEESLRRETDRVAHYLKGSTEQKLLEKVRHELLVLYAGQLLEKETSGCRAILRDDRADDLSRMYRLFCAIPSGLDPVSRTFKEHVAAEGTALVKQAEEDAEMKDGFGLPELQVFLRKVLELHDRFLAYTTDCFQGNPLFHKVLMEAFEVIICNKGVGGSSSAELLATFCDNILKKGGDGKLRYEAIEETLEKVVRLLVYIGDKDLFAEFCRKKLARRLLFHRSNDVDHERSFLMRLRQQCGGQFTFMMEGMVTDLTLGREYQARFEEYLISTTNPHANPGIDLNVKVLTTGFWPSFKSSFDLNLPEEMVKCVEVFEEFYQTKTKHRKLSWIYSLGTCNIIGKFDTRPVELSLTTTQASALLLFNSSDRLSYAEIKAQLNSTDDDVVRLLHSLSCARYRILNKEPGTKTISPTDVFEFNSKFTYKMRRIRIPLPPVDEKKKVIDGVDKDRRYTIDASIVRIMKSRKVLGHQQLVKECVEQLSLMFKPDFKVIKRRIEDLITRDYLERDTDNPNNYSYLA